MKMNTQLASLISIEQTAQSTAAMAYLGSTATVDGATAQARGRQRRPGRSLADKPASATINIKDSTGALVYTGNFTVNAGQQNFQWDGRGNNGTKWPDGNYTHVDLAKDATGSSGRDLDRGLRHGRQRRPDARARRRSSIGGQNFTRRQDQAGRAAGRLITASIPVSSAHHRDALTPRHFRRAHVLSRCSAARLRRAADPAAFVSLLPPCLAKF